MMANEPKLTDAGKLYVALELARRQMLAHWEPARFDRALAALCLNIHNGTVLDQEDWAALDAMGSGKGMA